MADFQYRRLTQQVVISRSSLARLGVARRGEGDEGRNRFGPAPPLGNKIGCFACDPSAGTEKNRDLGLGWACVPSVLMCF